jgi:deazaflavin-dependent oxidoreductase (nitroreductase family)
MNAGVKGNVLLYRLTKGRLGGKVKGAPVLLLAHVGRKSGTKRTAPLVYMRDGLDLVIVASRGGSDAPPALPASSATTPATTVRIGAECSEVVARRATPEEKGRLWPQLVGMFPDFDVYQSRTSREIEVVVLNPA